MCCLEKIIAEEIENYEPAELNTLLERFYAELKNKHGEDYEPESLKVMIASIERHLKNKRYRLSIVRDREFSSSNKYWTEKQNSFAWQAPKQSPTAVRRGGKKFS